MAPNTESYLCNLRSVDVGPATTQQAGTSWLTAALEQIYGSETPQVKNARSLYQRLLRAGSIASRQSCVADFAEQEQSRWSLFSRANARVWYQPLLEQRMRIFQDVSRAAALAAFGHEEEAPAHLLQVSCTGYEAPTATQRLVATREWGEQTRLLHLGHMGCFAAIPAAATAAALAGTPQAAARAVSVFHIELCTLHVALEALAAEQLVVQYLFADGAIRYDLRGTRPLGPHFSLLDTFEVLLPSSSEAMTWVLTSDGFRMTLEREVPRLVARNLPGLVSRFLSSHRLHASDISRWAIHPGGSKIIEGVAQCLELAEPALIEHAVAVFHSRGNMSSATLPHVWQAILADPQVNPGDYIVSLAFGPGLTVTGNLLRKEAAASASALRHSTLRRTADA